jgi:hypothetical protein
LATTTLENRRAQKKHARLTLNTEKVTRRHEMEDTADAYQVLEQMVEGLARLGGVHEEMLLGILVDLGCTLLKGNLGTAGFGLPVSHT